MTDTIPTDWETQTLSTGCEFLSGSPFNSKEFNDSKSGMPLIRIRDLVNQDLKTFYSGEFDERYKVSLGDVLIGMDGDFHVVKWKGTEGLLNQRICKLEVIDKETFHEAFLYQFLQVIVAEINRTTAATTVKHLSIKDLLAIEENFPPVAQQEKIADILISVDDTIEHTQAQVAKLQDLKTATMNELLTRGIGHTEFKESPFGVIPKNWNIKPYGEVLTIVKDSFTLEEAESYAPVVVRRNHNGVETRGEKLGQDILVKKQFRVNPGLFAISKRQIFHGSCGIVPTSIANNAIVSGEYLLLDSNVELDLHFLNYFSHTDFFQQQIVRTTYGVDVEKFVFKVDWWLKEQVPVPPLEEQLEINKVLSEIENQISLTASKLHQLELLKKSLMGDLLTGRVRVSVD